MTCWLMPARQSLIENRRLWRKSEQFTSFVEMGGGPENEPDMADLRGPVHAIWALDRFG